MNFIGSNKNAFAAVLSAGPGAQIVLEVSSWFRWDISTGFAIYISAFCAWVTLLTGSAGAMIAANGVRGCWRRLVDGPANPEPPKEQR